MMFRTFTILLLLFNFNLCLSQDANNSISLNNGSIEEQFEYVITKSNKYQDYKVVKTNWLYTLKAHTIDSIKALQEQLKNIKQVVNEQGKEIEVLKTNLEQTNNNLTQTITEKNSMSLFGIQMTKSGYNGLIWTIIAGLMVLLLLFIYKFKNSNAITKQAQLALSETEEEFEAHRKRALEREQKVMRRLQDEINKQKANNQ